jgi:hypothetical protein
MEQKKHQQPQKSDELLDLEWNINVSSEDLDYT